MLLECVAPRMCVFRSQWCLLTCNRLIPLLQSHVGSVGRCAVDNTTCVTPDRSSQRAVVNDQFRRLKQLLKQLKVSLLDSLRTPAA